MGLVRGPEVVLMALYRKAQSGGKVLLMVVAEVGDEWWG